MAARSGLWWAFTPSIRSCEWAPVAGMCAFGPGFDLAIQLPAPATTVGPHGAGHCGLCMSPFANAALATAVAKGAWTHSTERLELPIAV
jgi:hypothetical protein